MIDKRIFYCWFGHGEMSDLNKKCIASWKKLCPDYEIVEINESNFDYTITPYAQQAYEHGNWSYVSNAARLYYLNHENGFYLDTDVELAKPLDSLRVFDKGFITEFITSEPDSGVLGCGDGVCNLYNTVFNNLVPGTVLHKEFIKELYSRYDIHGQCITTYEDGFTILGEEYFPTVRCGLFTRNTIGVHYFENTWAKQWRQITDGYYPFPRVIAYLGNKVMHKDDNPEVVVQIKHLRKQFHNEDIISKLNYMHNPKVIKLFTRDFEATRIHYNMLAPTNTTVTPGGTIVTWLDI